MKEMIRIKIYCMSIPSRLFVSSFTKLLFGVIGTALLASATAHAASYYWDSDGNPAIGTPAKSTPGSGVWNSTNVLWNQSGTAASDLGWNAAGAANTNVAVFAGADAAANTYAITVDPTGLNNPTAIQFNNSGYSLSTASAQTLTTNGTISFGATDKTATIGNNLTVAGATSMTIGAALTGGNLVIDNGGTVTTTGTQNFLLRAGSGLSVQVNAGGNLISGGSVVVGTTGTDAGTTTLLVNGG
ncbi:MAG: hypothetical protein WCH98_21385, partial [Verrucomicrobiota bacterium]